MEILKAWKLWVVLIIVGGLSAYLFFIKSSRDEWELKASNLDKQLSSLNEKLSSNNKVIDALAIELGNQMKNSSELAATQEQLGQAARKRETEIRRLIGENKELRDWANAVLPSDIARMRKRPAITGHKDYQNWLSGPDALQPAGIEPSH